MNTEENKGKVEKTTKSKKTDKATITEKERFKGKLNKQEKKARSAAGKARRKNQGHEAVSDQKSHEFH